MAPSRFLFHLNTLHFGICADQFFPAFHFPGAHFVIVSPAFFPVFFSVARLAPFEGLYLLKLTVFPGSLINVVAIRAAYLAPGKNRLLFSGFYTQYRRFRLYRPVCRVPARGFLSSGCVLCGENF